MRSCCQSCSYWNLILFVVWIIPIRSWFVFIHSIICLINQFIFVTLLYPVKVDFVHQLLYTCFTLVFLDLLFICLTISYLSCADHSACWGSDRHAHQQDNTNSYIIGAVISLNTVSCINCTNVLFCIIIYLFVLIWNKFDFQSNHFKT